MNAALPNLTFIYRVGKSSESQKKRQLCNSRQFQHLLAMNTALEFSRTAETSSRTLSQLHALASSWDNAPEQLHHLRDDVDRLSILLESIRQNEQTVRLVTGLDDPTLAREVTLARRSLENTQTILAELSPEDTSGQGSSVEPARPSPARRRHRWLLRREDIARTQRSLQLSCQHILSRLVTLNL